VPGQQGDDGDEEERIDPNLLPPSKAQIDELTSRLDQLVARVSKIPALLIWLTAAVVATLIISG
jgi:hypothetical protein